jgi:hypothetical protein
MRNLVLTFVLFLLAAGAAFAATETVNPPILNPDGSVSVCITKQGAMQAILDANKAIPGLHLSMFKWQEVLLDPQGHNPQDQFRMWGCYHVAADVVAKAMRPVQNPGQTLTNAQTTTVAATNTVAATQSSSAPTNQSAQPASTNNTINDFLN